VRTTPERASTVFLVVFTMNPCGKRLARETEEEPREEEEREEELERRWKWTGHIQQVSEEERERKFLRVVKEKNAV
jgi:DNA-binding PadR family transcriptional regulator